MGLAHLYAFYEAIELLLQLQQWACFSLQLWRYALEAIRRASKPLLRPAPRLNLGSGCGCDLEHARPHPPPTIVLTKSPGLARHGKGGIVQVPLVSQKILSAGAWLHSELVCRMQARKCA